MINKNIAFDLVLNNNNQLQQQLQQSTVVVNNHGIIGEKRRYESIATKLRFSRETSKSPVSPIATRLRSYNSKLLL